MIISIKKIITVKKIDTENLKIVICFNDIFKSVCILFDCSLIVTVLSGASNGMFQPEMFAKRATNEISSLCTNN